MEYKIFRNSLYNFVEQIETMMYITPRASSHYLVTVTFEWSFAHDRHL